MTNDFRVMSIDYGARRTGVAFSDLTRQIVGETVTIATPDDRDRLVFALAQMARERGVAVFVMGCPLNMDDTESAQTLKCKQLAVALNSATGLPVVLEDERLTSYEAHEILRTNGVKTKNHKGKVDAVAAALILEQYLHRRDK